MSAARAAKLGLASASLALALAAAGCEHVSSVSSDRTLRIALTEYRLNPQSVRVSAGTLTILVHNYGRLTHNLVISMSGHPAGATRPIAPGQSATLMLRLTPGSYLMTSTILSDVALGEYGTLTVTS